MNISLNKSESYQSKFASRIAARLNDSTDHLPHDISERLKAARMQAIAQRKVVKLQTAAVISVSGNAAVMHLGGYHPNLWNRFASLLPLVALIAGLLAISSLQEQNRAEEIAEVDAELLTDDLPPAAYTDPGFLRFLNVQGQD